MTDLREAAADVVMSWFGATETEMPIHDAMLALRAALEGSEVRLEAETRLDEDAYCPCGHVESEHVHYCSADTRTGTCPCVAEYARLTEDSTREEAGR